MSDQNMPDFIFEPEETNQQPQSKQQKHDFNFTDTKLISRLLRAIGAIIIVASASTFLFQHWTPGSDLQRYLLLLGFTSVLYMAAAWFARSYLRNDPVRLRFFILLLLAMAGNLGMDVDLGPVPAEESLRDDIILFSESAGRFLVTVDPDKRDVFEKRFKGQPCACIG